MTFFFITNKDIKFYIDDIILYLKFNVTDIAIFWIVNKRWSFRVYTGENTICTWYFIPESARSIRECRVGSFFQ